MERVDTEGSASVHLPAISDGRILEVKHGGVNAPVLPDTAWRRNDERQLISSLVSAARHLGVLEDRMMHQEATLRLLMERAFGIQQEMEKLRHSTHAGLEQEQRERRLVSEHMQTVTHLVSQLQQQTADLRQSLCNTDRHVQQQTHAFVQLDVSHRAHVRDVHASLQHNAAVLSHLSAKYDSCEVAMDKLRKQQERERLEHLKSLEQLRQQMSVVQLRVQQLSKEQQSGTQHLQASIKQASNMNIMNLNQRSEELRKTVAEVFTSCQENHDRILSKALHHCEENSTAQQARHKEMHQQVAQALHSLEDSVRKESLARMHLSRCVDEEHALLKTSQQQASKALEERFEQSLHEVQKSLSSFQQLINTKHDLLWSRVQKEIQRVLKTVVVI